MKCKICEKEFTPMFSRAVTCGSVKCKKKNDLQNKYKGNKASDTSDKLVIMKNRFLTNSWY